MAIDSKQDAIVVGGGMGGLSAAAFLAREGKKVLVIEKHDKPGGYVTSFTRQGWTFDCSIAHLNELGEDQTIPRFLRYWGGSIRARRMQFKLRYFIDGQEFSVDTAHLPEDLIRCFPDKEREIRRYFDLTRAVMGEAMRLGVGKSPSEMGLLEKAAFGLRFLLKASTMRRYGLKNHAELLRALFAHRQLEAVLWAFYPVRSLNFLSNAWAWEKIRLGEYYYPEGGMQSIPNAAVAAIEKNGGRVLLRTEVARILVEGGRAVGVECGDGSRFSAEVIISNAPIHHTVFTLCREAAEFDRMRAELKNRQVFVSCFAIYMGVDAQYDLGGADYVLVLDSGVLDTDERELTPQDCPILVMVPPRPPGQQDLSVVVGAILPYEYRDSWLTGGTGERGPDYYRLKEEVRGIITERICGKLGEGFRKAIKYSLAATPLTFERYTRNEKGSIMGWAMGHKGFGGLLPHEAPVENMYFVGQWVFPGGGVPTVMASGYQVACKVLQKDGIDLAARLKAFAG